MLRTTLEVAITVGAPFVSRDSSAGRLGVDTPLTQTTLADGSNYYLIPFSLLRGRLRDAMEDLRRHSAVHRARFEVERIFGPRRAPGQESGWNPERGLLNVTDFVGPPVQADPRTSVSIRHDPGREAADTGALRVIEQPFPAGEEVSFAGEMSFVAPSRDGSQAILWQVRRALAWLARIGANVGVGSGRVLAVTVSRIAYGSPAFVADSRLDGAVALDLEISVRDPLCVARRRIADNLFESDDVISGAVVKGALATVLGQGLGLDPSDVSKAARHAPAEWRPLLEHLDKVAFSHAFPVVSGGTRPVVRPLSLVQDRHGTLYRDVALCDGAILLRDKDGVYTAPVFAVDWKPGRIAEKLGSDFPWPEVHRELRVRTAVDPGERRAQDQGLFGYEMVLPHRTKWLGSMNVEGVPTGERAAVVSGIRALLAFGPAGLGKTKARWAGVLSLPQGTAAAAPLPDGIWVLTLQTPALLFDASQFDESSGDRELWDAYDRAWSQLSCGTLRLVRYYARQSLVGGYVVGRFRAGKGYHPLILTDAGSVFVLREQGASAAALVHDWRVRGLPLPKAVEDEYTNSWRGNPFLREHGFGELAVNLECHLAAKPKPGEFQDAGIPAFRGPDPEVSNVGT